MADTNDLLGYGVAGAASSLIGGGLSYLTGRSSQERAAELQWENWKKMFDYQAEYNKPVNQLKRSAAVGVNPFVSPTGAQMVGMSSQQMGAPASAPGASAVPFEFGSNFNQILQGLLNYRSSIGKDIENSKLPEWFDAQIREKLVHAGYEDVMSQGQELANEITRLYGKMEKRAQISNLMKDTLLKASQIMLNDDLGELAAQQRLTELARESHYRAEAVLGQKNIDAFDTRLNAWLDTVKSEQAANYSSAHLRREQALTENRLRDERYTELVIENGLRGIQFANEDEFSHQDREQALRYSIEQADLLSKENNVFYWRFAVDVLKAVADGVISATFASKLLKFGKAGKEAKTAEEFQKKAKKVGDIMEHVGSPSETGSGAPVFPRDKDKYPNLYRIWNMGK